MAFTYENVNPTLIPNTDMQIRLRDGVPYQYLIKASDGYVLHDGRHDEEVYDMETGEPTGEVIYRYATGTKTVAYSYDFTVSVPDTITDLDGNTIAVNKIGIYGFFAVPISAVPENNTYGGVNNEHETI